MFKYLNKHQISIHTIGWRFLLDLDLLVNNVLNYFIYKSGCKSNNLRVEMKMYCPIMIKMLYDRINYYMLVIFGYQKTSPLTMLNFCKIISKCKYQYQPPKKPHIVQTLIFIPSFLCLLISVNMHFWTLLEMLSAGLCWPFTVTETRASTIMASLIIGHLFSVAAFKASTATRNISETEKQSLSWWEAWSALPYPLRTDVLLALLRQSFSDLQAKIMCLLAEGLLSPLWDSAAASPTDMN